MLPLLATAMVASAGNIYYGLWYPIVYYGLWYPIVVAVLMFVIGLLFVHETRHVRIHSEH